MLNKIKNKIKNRRLTKAMQKEYGQSAQTSFDNAEIAWVAYEYPQHERGVVWKIIAGLFVLSAIVFGVMYEALTFSLAIGAFALVYYLMHREKPKQINIILSNIGIKIGNIKYAYSDIKEFWVIYEPPFVRTLNLRVANGFINEVKIELDGQDPAVVREFLKTRIKELEGQKEGATDLLLRLFKL